MENRSLPTASDVLEHLDALRSFVVNAELSERTTASFFTFPRNFLLDVEKKKVQLKLTSYFNVAQ